MHRIEKRIVILLNHNRVKAMDHLSTLISNITALVIFWTLALLLIAFNNWAKSLEIAIGLTIVLVEHLLFSELLLKWGAKKMNMARQRPYKRYPQQIQPVGRKFSDASFPSSHMASMVGGFVVIVSYYQFLFPWVILAAALLGWSRIRNGMHYPSDILAGIILGLGYGFTAMEMMRLFH